MFNTGPIKKLNGGRYALRLSDHERNVLKSLPEGLRQQMADGQDDGSMMRLFPPAYSEDLGRQVDYDRLMRDDLMASHLEALQILEYTAEAKELTDEQLQSWMRALNQLRLVLGTRLDITEDTSEDDFDEGDPRLGAYSLYSYLGYLQDSGVEALSEGW